MKHYTEADLLELHYVPSEETQEAQNHLRDCGECGNKFERLGQKLRSAAMSACPVLESKPESFWTRQRISILRRTQTSPQRQVGVLFRARTAVAAMIVFSVLSFAIYRITPGSPPAVATGIQPDSSTLSQPVAAAVLESVETSDDPWSSRELVAFKDVVEWEAWVAESSEEGNAL